jgi:hypothetical protein
LLVLAAAAAVLLVLELAPTSILQLLVETEVLAV